ncbi:hypothetical protein [Edwardsiella piscicida]|uniref:hypothetical protein n=1 Tax=Edwardsiella piscicida TaxID=1263550 RepID=UPI00247A36D9|nr:hypothetical protein [Edwardsiella piscicida]WGS75557.1 hypothetical protein PED68_09260 [Edwardsiella piscicida]WGS78946.1 hypothetical protein PED70_09265 [Edwardsiella piscicida]
MIDKTEQALVYLLEELLEKGDFFYSAIEGNDMTFDFEDWKERALVALEESKSKHQPTNGTNRRGCDVD